MNLHPRILTESTVIVGIFPVVTSASPSRSITRERNGSRRRQLLVTRGEQQKGTCEILSPRRKISDRASRHPINTLVHRIASRPPRNHGTLKENVVRALVYRHLLAPL